MWFTTILLLEFVRVCELGLVVFIPGVILCGYHAPFETWTLERHPAWPWRENYISTDT